MMPNLRSVYVANKVRSHGMRRVLRVAAWVSLLASAQIAMPVVAELGSVKAERAAHLERRTQDSLTQMIESAETVVAGLAAKLEQLHVDNKANPCSECEALNACGTEQPDTECTVGFGLDGSQCQCEGRPVNKERSVVKPHADAPKEVVQNFVCSTAGIDDEFQTNMDNFPDLRWQQFGTRDGMYRQYPAAAWRRDESGYCADYEPRLRPWYVSGASGPKDVVLLIDSSGSMSGSRMERAKAAAASVVSSLAFYDYVSVVDFDSQTSTSGPLVRADTQGKCAAKAFINDIGADGGTDFAAGFRAAFDVLEDRDSGSSGCEKVILFLTDGVSDHPADDYVRERNPDAEVRIFSFSFGDGADTTSPKSIACANGGVWQHVDSDGDLIFAMGSYYNVFAQGLTEGSIRWSEPYESFSGLGPLATASKPVFDTEHTPPQFLGIAAVDIGMCSIFESWDGSEVGQLLLNRSSSCAQLNLGPCELQAIRLQLGGAEAVCPGLECELELPDGGYSCRTQSEWEPEDQGPVPEVEIPDAAQACPPPCRDGDVCPNNCMTVQEQGYCDYSVGECTCLGGWHGNDCGCAEGQTCAEVVSTTIDLSATPWEPTNPCGGSSVVASTMLAAAAAAAVAVASRLNE